MLPIGLCLYIYMEIVRQWLIIGQPTKKKPYNLVVKNYFVMSEAYRCADSYTIDRTRNNIDKKKLIK
jgi:hypothetical protein